MRRATKWIFDNRLGVARVIIGTGIAILIVVHGLWPDKFTADTTTLGLIVLLLVVLILPEIEEFEAFGFKLKRRIRDVQARAAAEEASSPPPKPDAILLLDEVQTSIASTAADDPLGVALEARTTVYATLRQLHRLVDLEPSRQPTDIEILRELERRQYVTSSQSEIIKEIIALANKAAHGGRISAEDAARLNDAAQSVSKAITSYAPRAFEADVGAILASDPSLEIQSSATSPDPGFDYRVTTPQGAILVEIKFWMRPRVDRVLLTRAERLGAEAGRLYVVVPNVEFTTDKLDLPRLARIVTVAQFQHLVATGALVTDD